MVLKPLYKYYVRKRGQNGRMIEGCGCHKKYNASNLPLALKSMMHSISVWINIHRVMKALCLLLLFIRVLPGNYQTYDTIFMSGCVIVKSEYSLIKEDLCENSSQATRHPGAIRSTLQWCRTLNLLALHL